MISHLLYRLRMPFQPEPRAGLGCVLGLLVWAGLTDGARGLASDPAPFRFQTNGFVSIPAAAPTNLPQSRTWLFQTAGAHWGSRVVGLGDVTGDRLGDLALSNHPTNSAGGTPAILVIPGARTGHGQPELIPTPQGIDFLGRLGDVDGDGVPEWFVGSRGGPGRPGVIEVRSGRTRAGTFPVRWRWQAPREVTLLHADGIGDVNADGFADLAVALQGAGQDQGVAVFPGSDRGLPSQPAWVVPPRQAHEDFGASLAPGGDFDGDGRAEWIVGAPQATNALGSKVGRVYLFRFRSATLPPEVAWMGEGSVVGGGFGFRVAGELDLDANVWPELLVAVPSVGSTNASGLLIYKGPGPAPQSQGQWWRTDWFKPAAALGYGLAALPDFNGDRWGDFTFSAPGGDGNRTNSGWVNIHAGTELAPTGSPVLLLSGHAENGRFGTALTSAGDFNGDGLTDLAIGSPNLNDGVPGAGRVDLILGARFPNHVLIRWETQETTPAPSLPPDLAAPPASSPPSSRQSPILWTIAGAGGVLLVVLAVVASRRAAERAVAEERIRVARDLHDRMGALMQQILHKPPADAVGALRSMAGELEEVVWSTNPGPITLEEFATHLAERVPAALAATPLRLTLDLPLHLPPGKLPPLVRRHLEALVGESLANTLKHAQASEFRLQLRVDQGRLQLELSDNGRGFDPAQPVGTGSGLANLRGRIAEIGGSISWESQPGSGTRIRCEIPHD